VIERRNVQRAVDLRGPLGPTTGYLLFFAAKATHSKASSSSGALALVRCVLFPVSRYIGMTFLYFTSLHHRSQRRVSQAEVAVQ